MHRSLVLMILLAAPVLRAENMNCNSNDSTPATVHDFTRQPSDVVEPRHLEVSRPFSGSANKLEFSVCAASLHVRTRPGLDHLRLVVDLGDQPDGHTLADYVQRIHTEDAAATIELKLPTEAHATVTLELPMPPGSNTSLNLGRGDLQFNAIGSAGEREINLGAGHFDLTAGGSSSYSTLRMNIGLGSLHDHRPHGHDAHFVIAREEAGSGSGPLSINIGAGTLNIRE